MSKSTLIWSVQQTSEPAESISGNLAGHNLILTITESSIIDPKCLVFQRAPLTPGSTDYEDCFYSLASVNDMADLAEDAPALGSVFYRTNSLNLLFGNLEALNTALADIESAMGSLCAANDLALELGDPSVRCFPADSHERYWGLSSNTSLTDEQIWVLSHEPGFTRTFSHVFNTDGPKYIYFVYRSSLGAGTFTVGGNPVAMTLVTRNVVNRNGHSASYNVYRSTATQNGAAVTFAVA